MELKVNMAAQGLSQKEYLKKYLSSGTDDKKKKKKSKHIKPGDKGLRIVDDDIDLKNMRPLEDNELDLYHLAEDAPQIAGIVDERPDELRTLEEFGSKRWKVVADENGIEDIKVTAIRHTSEISTEEPKNNQKNELKRKKQRLDEDSDESSVRKHTVTSPVRKQMVEISSDESPPRKSELRDAHISSLKRANFESGESRNYRVERDSGNSRKRVGKNLKESNAVVSSPKRLERPDSDESPPRKSGRKVDLDESPPRKFRRKDDSDESPPRRSKKDDYTEQSSHKKFKRKANFDHSPPRKLKRKGYSPIRKNNLDEIPLRKGKPYDDNDDSPTGRLRRSANEISLKNSHSKSRISHDSMRRLQHPGNSSSKLQVPESSHSPHRYSKTSVSTTKKADRQNLSSVNKSGKPHTSSKDRKSQNNNSDEWPIRHSRPYKSTSKMSSGSDSDISPERKRGKNELLPSRSKPQRFEHGTHRSQKHADSDESPIRRMERKDGGSGQESRTKVERTLDGRKAGLQDAKELKREIEDLKHKEAEMFAKMDPSVSGQGATPVMRDRKTGRRRDLEQEAKKKLEEDKKTTEHKVKYTRWGKGLKQVEDQEQRLQQDLHEMSKPLARYAGDEDLEKHLRNQEREGDPMLLYIRSKAQDVSVKGKPKYQGSFLPNRFGIPPGHRWDGVDRSSGYEKQWFEQLNAKRALEDEAYKWSTSDM